MPLALFARRHGLELRFIEFMPLDAEQNWTTEQVLTGQRIRDCLERSIVPLIPAPRLDPSQPATDYQYADGRGRVGFINPVTQPFCEACNRLRVTAEGQLRNCLFSTEEWDVRGPMRQGVTDDFLAARLAACVAAKKAGHGIDSPQFQRPARSMYQIGG